MRKFWTRFAAIVAIVAGVGIGASAVPASAVGAHSASAKSAAHSSPSDIWW